jgi:DNA-directed RNA polymerase specialized sigma subunit
METTDTETRADEDTGLNLADDTLKVALATLLPLDRRILEMRSQGRTVAEIAAALRISRSGVYRLEAAARNKLKMKLKAAARTAGARRGAEPGCFGGSRFNR